MTDIFDTIVLDKPVIKTGKTAIKENRDIFDDIDSMKSKIGRGELDPGKISWKGIENQKPVKLSEPGEGAYYSFGDNQKDTGDWKVNIDPEVSTIILKQRELKRQLNKIQNEKPVSFGAEYLREIDDIREKQGLPKNFGEEYAELEKKSKIERLDKAETALREHTKKYLPAKYPEFKKYYDINVEIGEMARNSSEISDLLIKAQNISDRFSRSATTEVLNPSAALSHITAQRILSRNMEESGLKPKEALKDLYLTEDDYNKLRSDIIEAGKKIEKIRGEHTGYWGEYINPEHPMAVKLIPPGVDIGRAVAGGITSGLSLGTLDFKVIGQAFGYEPEELETQTDLGRIANMVSDTAASLATLKFTGTATKGILKAAGLELGKRGETAVHFALRSLPINTIELVRDQGYESLENMITDVGFSAAMGALLPENKGRLFNDLLKNPVQAGVTASALSALESKVKGQDISFNDLWRSGAMMSMYQLRGGLNSMSFYRWIKQKDIGETLNRALNEVSNVLGIKPMMKGESVESYAKRARESLMRMGENAPDRALSAYNFINYFRQNDINKVKETLEKWVESKRGTGPGTEDKDDYKVEPLKKITEGKPKEPGVEAKAVEPIKPTPGEEIKLTGSMETGKEEISRLLDERVDRDVEGIKEGKPKYGKTEGVKEKEALPVSQPGEIPVKKVGEGAAEAVIQGENVPVEPVAGLEKMPIVKVNPNGLRRHPDLPNWKLKANKDTGIVPGEELGPYKDFPAKPIVIWVRNDGKKYIATGSHRAYSGVQYGQDVWAQFVYEKDGFTKEDAFTLDAEDNIRDNKGEVIDYVTYYEYKKGLTREDAEKGGLLAGIKAKQGWAIAREASNDLRALFKAGKINAAKAAAIASAAPGKEQIQREGIKKRDSMNVEQLENFVKAIVRFGPSRQAIQGDLLSGFDDYTEYAEKFSEVQTRKIKETRSKILAIEGALRHPIEAKSMGLEFMRQQDEMRKEMKRLYQDVLEWKNPDSERVAMIEREAGITKPKKKWETEKEQVTKPMSDEEAEKRQGKIFEISEEERAAEKKRVEAFVSGSGAINQGDIGPLRREDLKAPFAKGEGIQGDISEFYENYPGYWSKENFAELMPYVEKLWNQKISQAREKLGSKPERFGGVYEYEMGAVEVQEKYNKEQLAELVRKHGKRTVPAKELKVGDFFQNAESGEVYFVTKIEDGKVHIQDGKKKVVEVGDRIHIIGKLNEERITFAGGQTHEPEEGKGKKLDRGAAERIREKIEKRPGAAEKLEHAQKASKRKSELKSLRNQTERLENVYGLEETTKSKYRRKITLGRTDKIGEMTADERKSYIEFLQKTDHKKPETQRIIKEMAPKPVNDPVLKEFIDDIEAKKGSVETLPMPEGGKRAIKTGQFYDIDWSLHDIEMKTNVPVFQKNQIIRKEERDLEYEVKNRILNMFKKLGIDPKKILYNVKSEERIFNYLMEGDAEGISDDELGLAEEIKRIYKQYEFVVKLIRHRRYMATGELPPDINNDAGKRLMEEGAAIFKKGDEEAYNKWLNNVKFGVREKYVPLHRDEPEDLQLDAAARSAFGRGFTKERSREHAKYDPEHPLIGDLYKYMIRAERILRLEPHLWDMQKLFNEHKDKIDPGLMDRYFSSYYKTNRELDITQKALIAGMRQFYRVRIPQKVVAWIMRNLMQPIAVTLPKVFTPTSMAYWKNTHKLITGAIKYARANKEKVNGIFRAKPWVKEYFNRYVSSLDTARTHILLSEQGEFEQKPLRNIMWMMDAISKWYSSSDEINRAQVFIYAIDAGDDVLRAYRKNPTAYNWKKFLDVCGITNAPMVEQQEIARLVDQGKDRDAVSLAAERLSHSTQFRYPRGERGLMWQEPGTGAHTSMPIATYWKGYFQNIWKEGVKPIIDYSKAKYNKKASKYDRHRAAKGLTHILAALIANYGVNKAYQLIYGVESGQYGWNQLVYVPGGPVIRSILEITDVLRSGISGEKGFTSKLAYVADKTGDIFVPFYQLLEKAAGYRGRTEDGTYRFHDKLGFVREAKRVLGKKIDEIRGKEPDADRRNWIELTGAEVAQRLILGGAYSPKKDTVIKKYKQYIDEPDYEKSLKIKKELEAMLRKYPVRTKRADEPRTLENIENIVPGIKDEY